MSKSQAAQPRLQAVDPIWDQMRKEAEAAMAAEPALGSFIFATVLSHARLEEAVCHRLVQRLNHSDVDGGLISQTFQSALDAEPELGAIFRADLAAVFDRDPACTRYLEPLLYFKGFQALVTHRFAHVLWTRGRRDYAFYLQSQASRMFAVDIHPAARFGKGLMLDHATGFVVGETATVGDNLLIGAGAKVLGNINVGNCSRVAAGSVVLQDVPPNVTVAGVPAKIVGPAGCAEPARSMEQGWVDDFGGL